jgi:hypothetical protein
MWLQMVKSYGSNIKTEKRVNGCGWQSAYGDLIAI